MISTHVLNRGGQGVRSPIDGLRGGLHGLQLPPDRGPARARKSLAVRVLLAFLRFR